jgi:hypothetical protein
MDCKFTQFNAAESLLTAGQQLGAMSGSNPNPVLNIYLGEVMESIGGASLPRAVTFYRQAADSYTQLAAHVFRWLSSSFFFFFLLLSTNNQSIN